MRLTHFLKESKGIKGLMGFLLLLNFYIYGTLSGLQTNQPKPVIFESKITPKAVSSDVQNEVAKPAGDIVVSKNGTRYYYVWCSGSSRIKPENRRYFASPEEAQKEGYKPASNCPGL